QLAFADLQAQLAGRGVGSEMGFAVAANGVAEQFTAQLVEIEVDAPVVVGLTQIEGQLAVEATAQLRLQSRGIEVSQRQLELQVDGRIPGDPAAALDAAAGVAGGQLMQRGAIEAAVGLQADRQLQLAASR